MAKKRKSITKLFYFIVVMLLGVLIGVLYQNKNVDVAKKSLEIDNELSDNLLKLGFRNEDILSQSRAERKQGSASWVEYYREMNFPKNIDLKIVENMIRSLVKKYQASFKLAQTNESKAVIEIYAGKRLLSKLVLFMSQGQNRTGTKKIAVVIDDVGYTKDLSRFLDIGIPVTFAVLPHERFTKAVCSELSQKKMPYILHLPLEPDAYPAIDPGKSALLTNMSDAEIKKMFLSDIASVPCAVGVSNHMGSRFSASREKMRVLLKLVKDKDLFYFDSYTSTATQAGNAAREIGIRFAENAIFLDNVDEKETVKKQLQYALKKAKKYGHIAVIGHISRKALPDAIKESLPDFKKNGVDFVYLTDMVPQAK